MRVELYAFQEIGAEWLAGKTHALLADDMGLGKTPQAIRGADRIGANRILVVCPSVAKINWQREFARFGEIKREFKVIQTKKDKWEPGASLIFSFDMAGDVLSKLENSPPYDLLIVDESHYLKSLDTKRTRAVLSKTGLIHKAKCGWFLSGTPTPNGYISELWPILFTLGVIKTSYSRFVELCCKGYLFRGRFVITGTREERIPDIKRMLSQIMLRRKKVDVLPELPEITFQEIQVAKGAVDIELQASFTQYVFPVDRREELVARLESEEAAIATVVERLGDSEAAMQALEAMSKSVATLRRYRGLQKVEAVVALLKEELESNAYEKLVIFAVHRDVIEGLRVGLIDFSPVTLYGGTEENRKQINIDRFQKDDKTRVFIANIIAAGPSITLTRAHNIVFVEQDWVPGNNAQAAMRCHRIGQKNAVLVRTISLDDPIDERISNALKKKTRQLLQIFE